MRTTPLDRLHFNDTYREGEQFYRQAVILIPTFTQQSFDQVTQTGYDVSVGDGSGRTVTRWTVYLLQCRIVKVDQNMKLFGKLALAVEIGDLVFTVKPDQLQIIDLAVREPHAYIYVDGETFRPTDRNSEGVGNIERWTIGCPRYNPVFRRAGY